MGMKKSEHLGLRTWVEIDTKAIRTNYRAFRTLIPREVKMMGVVKSNAYGHNFIEFALELEKLGIDMLAVDSILEALALRAAKVRTPILVLGYTLPEMFPKAVGKNIHLTISSIEGLKSFLKFSNAHKVPVHIKVDTGMHRQGFLRHEQEKLFEVLASTSKKINISGLYTHFAAGKDPQNKISTQKQLEVFELWRDAFSLFDYKPLVHAGATGGAIVFPEAHFDMVRIGIGLYGIPAAETVRDHILLKPVLSWKTIIAEVKEIPPGSGVGYDHVHTTKRATRIAVCPIGYWHGYSRTLSNNADVLIAGKRVSVLGRISMDMIVVDVTDIARVKMGDEVVLIGRSKKEEVSAVELAQNAGTTAYEILTRLNPLMKRIYK